MRLPGAYRSLARPSSALEPSHPLTGLYQLCLYLIVSVKTHLTSNVHTFTQPQRVFWTLGPSPVTHVSGCIGSLVFRKIMSLLTHLITRQWT